MAEEIDSIFQANINKILRKNGKGEFVERAKGTGGTLRIVCSTVDKTAKPFITVNESRTGRVIFLANIQKETLGDIHPSNKKVVTMFLIDESYQKVSNKFLEIFTLLVLLYLYCTCYQSIWPGFSSFILQRKNKRRSSSILFEDRLRRFVRSHRYHLIVSMSTKIVRMKLKS